MAATLTALPTNTLLPTSTVPPAPTASPTPANTLTPTSSVPMVSVSLTTNCRSGPTTAYDVLGVLNVGESARVVGRSLLTDTMIIQLPSRPGLTCWLWAQNASMTGDIASLLTHPDPGHSHAETRLPFRRLFKVVYLSTIQCDGQIRSQVHDHQYRQRDLGVQQHLRF